MPQDHIARVTYNFTCDDGPPAEFEVHRMRLVEALSTTYELDLELVTRDLEVATDQLLGGACHFEIVREERVRSVYGIIDRVELIGRTEEQLIVGVRVVPAFALMGHTINSRIFQEMSVLDIVAAVLDAGLGTYSRTHDPGSSGRGTAQRDYCVQYRETDREFVERLLEEEGITYHFVHDEGAGHEVLTFTYENSDYPDIANVDGTALVPIVTTGADEHPVESLTGLDFTRTSTVTSALFMDYDWKVPTTLLSPQSGADERGRERRVYRHDQRRWIEDDGLARAADFLAAATMGGAVGRGTSNVITFAPGTVFELERHHLASLEMRWVITRVEHRGSAPEVLLSTGTGANDTAAGRYLNVVSCLPETTTIRPARRIPKPRAYGPEIATVVGPGGEEIHTDEHGRIKVQFHWEENPHYDDTSSCWVRVRQNWAGAGWGFQFLPRIGMEVVVEFVAGNPDRPLVNGCVYNGQNPVPYALPGSKTQSGIKTNTVAGSGSNELRFEDAAGSEELYMHAQKDMNTKVEDCQTLSVGVDRSISIGNNLTDKITKDKKIEVGGDHTEEITGNMDLSVGKSQIVTITADRTETIGGKRVQYIGSTSDVKVKLKSDEFVGAMKAVKVIGLYTEAVGASRSITAVGAITLTAGVAGKFQCRGGLGLKSQKTISIDADEDLTTKTVKKTTMESGEDMAIDAKKKMGINVADELVLKCGEAEIALKKDGTIILKGKDISLDGSGKITIKASGDVNIKGAKVNEN